MVEYSRQWLLDPYCRQRGFWGALELYIMSASKATDISFVLWMRPQVNNQYCTLMCCVPPPARWHVGIFFSFNNFWDYIALLETSSGSVMGLETLSRAGVKKSEPVHRPLGSFTWQWNSLPLKHLFESSTDHTSPKTEHAIFMETSSTFRSHSSSSFCSSSFVS